MIDLSGPSQLVLAHHEKERAAELDAFKARLRAMDDATINVMHDKLSPSVMREMVADELWDRRWSSWRWPTMPKVENGAALPQWQNPSWEALRPRFG